MPLGFQVETPLNIPAEAFTEDVTTIVVTGYSYGGTWAQSAIPTHLPPNQATSIGSIVTEAAPRQPDRAVEAAEAWIKQECRRLGLTLVEATNLNSHYGQDEAPYCAGASFVISRPK